MKGKSSRACRYTQQVASISIEISIKAGGKASEVGEQEKLIDNYLKEIDFSRTNTFQRMNESRIIIRYARALFHVVSTGILDTVNQDILL